MTYQIIVKPGVVFKEINKYIIEFLIALQHCCDKFQRSYTITSANDGKHCEMSYHYKNMAWDVRLHDLPASHWYVLADNIRAGVGKYFDIIVENINDPENVHLHCEADLSKLADFILENGSV